MDGQILGWQVGGFVEFPVPPFSPTFLCLPCELGFSLRLRLSKNLRARWGVESQAKEDMDAWLQLLTFNQKNHFSCWEYFLKGRCCFEEV